MIFQLFLEINFIKKTCFRTGSVKHSCVMNDLTTALLVDHFGRSEYAFWSNKNRVYLDLTCSGCQRESANRVSSGEEQ